MVMAAANALRRHVKGPLTFNSDRDFLPMCTLPRVKHFFFSLLGNRKTQHVQRSVYLFAHKNNNKNELATLNHGTSEAGMETAIHRREKSVSSLIILMIIIDRFLATLEMTT